MKTTSQMFDRVFEAEGHVNFPTMCHSLQALVLANTVWHPVINSIGVSYVVQSGIRPAVVTFNFLTRKWEIWNYDK